MVIVVFKRTVSIDNIGFAVCKLKEGGINVETLNPDGSTCWKGGILKKK